VLTTKSQCLGMINIISSNDVVGENTLVPKEVQSNSAALDSIIK
jgi:hypothetical protein